MLRISFYLDDQVDIWRRVGDGEDRRSGQCRLVHVWSVRLQDVFQMFRVQVEVEVLGYLKGDGGFTLHHIKDFVKKIFD